MFTFEGPVETEQTHSRYDYIEPWKSLWPKRVLVKANAVLKEFLVIIHKTHMLRGSTISSEYNVLFRAVLKCDPGLNISNEQLKRWKHRKFQNNSLFPLSNRMSHLYGWCWGRWWWTPFCGHVWTAVIGGGHEHLFVFFSFLSRPHPLQTSIHPTAKTGPKVGFMLRCWNPTW